MAYLLFINNPSVHVDIDVIVISRHTQSLDFRHILFLVCYLLMIGKAV